MSDTGTDEGLAAIDEVAGTTGAAEFGDEAALEVAGEEVAGPALDTGLGAAPDGALDGATGAALEGLIEGVLGGALDAALDATELTKGVALGTANLDVAVAGIAELSI